jgi:Domain of unknown function (DUF6398)
MATHRNRRSGTKRNARQGRRRPGTRRSASRTDTTAGTSGHARGGGSPAKPDLLTEIARTMSTGQPLDLLADVSGLITALDPRCKNPFDTSVSEGTGAVSLEELAQTFAEVDTPETSALLACLSQMASDDLVRARARRALAKRAHGLPDWLARLGETRVHRAVEMVEVLGDGDDLLLGVRLPAGQEIVLVVYIDHNMGTVVKDAFAVPGTLTEVLRAMRAKSDKRDVTFSDISLADAKARASDAVEVGARMFPPPESESWPACRPLVEWALRLMPDGGTGYEHPEWSEEQTQALADHFFASPFGSPLDDADHRRLLHSILWFGSGYGPGDPMRWSAVSAEIILLDWMPRKLEPDVRLLSKAPGLLRAFIRYCHDARGIRPGLTAQTLTAVDQVEPEYQRVIQAPRLQGPHALLAAVGALDVEDHDLPGGIDSYAEFAYGEGYMLGRLADAVGGEAALNALDDEPLPDEEFSWTGIHFDIRPVVTQVLAACDECCDQMLGTEYRTACRRLLARVAAADPAVFRRKSSPVVSAAAICWLIGKGNDVFSPYGDRVMVKDMMGHFGLRSGSASQRATTFLKAAGMNPEHYGNIQLGTPDMLVSKRRRDIITARDRYRQALTDG